MLRGKWKYEYFENDYICEVDSISKIGFAGIRFGFMITKNKKLAKFADEYLQNVALGQNLWSNKSFVMRYDYITDRKLYKSIYKQLQKRHEQIREIIPSELIISNTIVPYFFVAIPKNKFDKIGVDTVAGEAFSTTNQYSRISMMLSNDDWNELLRRLIKLFNNRID